MFLGLVRLFLVIVFIITIQQVIAHDAKQKHGGGRNSTKTTNIVPKNRTVHENNKFSKNAKQLTSNPVVKTRKNRGIPLAALAGIDRAALGLNPVVVPYGTRLTSLGYQQAPALQQLPQYRGLVPATGGLIQNAAALRLPYGLQLARLLPALSLYRNRLQLPVNGAGGMATDVHVFKRPNRLKYDSIPIKPNLEPQEIIGNGLNLPALLQLNNAEQGMSDMSDDGEADLDELGGVCLPNPCHNGGSCVNLGETFECICKKGYTGKNCKERNPCLPNPCHNEGQCTVSGSSFECSCSIGWKGESCEEPNRCHPNPCTNGGLCTELEFDYECTCPHGFRGKSCEEKRSSCSPNPCLNEGQCIETSSGSHDCICKPGFSGPICSVTQNKCLQNPCQNGGSCIESAGGAGFECRCSIGYKGINCEERSPCQSDTCQNGGTCFETESGFKCLCPMGFEGKTCSVRHSCQPNVCKNGAKCIEHDSGFKCICPSGYKGSYCDEMDHCRPNPCQHGGDCVETENGFKCHCQAQYQGLRCEDLNMCVPNPCKNGGQCLGYEGGYKCMCPPGYKGTNCDDKNPCDPNPCHNRATCLQVGDHFKCSCRRGYTGEQCKMVDTCLSNPCQHGGSCKAEEGGFVCTCPAKYRGTFCNEREPCHPNPCRNGGKCLSTSEGFVCRCATGYRGETCTEEDECEPNPCQNGGRCMAHYFGGGFDCECPLGFRGTSCQDKDPCRPDPCGHGGFCTEIGGGFACNCTLGFKGSTCQEIDQCHPNPCAHGGYCREVVGGTGFACQCIPGYKGARCIEKDRCHPNPCLHDAMCMEVNDELGFLCNCTAGYRGSHCQDVDPCRPNPCLNSGACLHTDDGFVCNCSNGFKGKHCQERDLCKPNPCQFGNKCHQTGIDSYQCVKNLCNPSPCMHNGRCIEINDEDYTCACAHGYTGKNCNELDLCHPNPCLNGGMCSQTKNGGYKCDCTPGYDGINCSEFEKQANADGRHKVPEFHSTVLPNNLKDATPTHPTTEVALHGVCRPNPCQNGGSCTKNGDSFDCTCSKGFKGKHCELIDYCNPNPCKNRGVCVVEEGKGYSCVCQPGFTGFHCQADHCHPNPCRNRGLCVRDKTNRYRCTCHNGFLGRNCEINSCIPNPCKNDGLCVTVRGKGYQCKCRDGFNGPHCESNPCYPNPCNNGGSCLVFYTVYLCKCPRAYRGTRCNVLIPEQALAPAPPPVTSANFISEAAPVRKTTEHFKANPCHSNPCLNSAVCLETIDDNFECFCRGDYSGPRCEDVGAYTYSSGPKFFPGKGEECQHCDRNAHCVGGHCICKSGFVGDGLDCWVETQRDKNWACEASPCMNGGTCKPGISKCVCRLGYVGDYCESYCPPSIHLSFDKYTQGTLQDDSGSENNGLLANGAQIVPHGGKCGNAAILQGGDVLLDGAHFDKIPREAITIATWIKLDTNKGIQSIFDTVGNHSKHKDGQYHFEIEDGKVRWFHRNENHDTIFSLLTRPVVREGVWTQITATYNAKKQRARVFVNGDLREEVRGQGLLSQDWAGKAGIGRHKHQFGNRLLRGMIDEFYIFPCELPRLEILVVLRHCRVYFKHSKKVTEESSKTRGPASIMTPPNNGQRNNQPLLSHPSHPAVSQSTTNVAPANQRQPGASADYIANNLQQILASLTGGDRLPGSHPSMMYRPYQAYVAPKQQAKQAIANRPVQYQTVKPPMGNSHQIPQTLSSNLWNNRQPSAVAALAAQASLRHGTPASMQQVNRNRQPGMVASHSAQRLGSLRPYTPRVMQQIHMPLLTKASLMQQMNTNRQPAVVSPLQPQASLRHDTPARMPQANTVGIQRVPLRPSVQGQFQRLNPLSTPAVSSVQGQNKGAIVIKPQGFSDRINSYGQIHNPIVWHIPLRNIKTGLLGGLQKPFFSAAPTRPALSNSLGQSSQLNMLQNIPVRNRTLGSVHKPYVASFQQPFIQKQRVNLVQPLNPLPGGPRAEVTTPLQQRQQQQQKQQSLAYKMALLDVPSPQTTITALSPSIKQVPSAQIAAISQKNAPLMRPSSTNYYVKPPYSPSVQIPVNTLHSSLSGVLPQVSPHLPQVIPQVAPFSRHYIYGQHSWPWGALKNQLISSQSPSPIAYGRSPQRYQTTVSPYAVSPQVLLYYYFYPRTLTNPQTKLTMLNGQNLKGSFWQKLREQISSAAFNGKPVVRHPSGTGQTQGKSTVIRTGQVQPNIAPNGAIKQLGQMSENTPYYRLVASPSKAPLSSGIVAGHLANQLQIKKEIQTPLPQAQVNNGMKQMTNLPQQTARISPNVGQYLNALTRQQATVKTQLPVLQDRTSQLTNGLLNRPIYIQTVPYHIYNMLQQVPALNTQSGNQRYLSKVLSDILRLRYLKQKKKKKKKKKKRGTKESKIKNR